MIGTAMPYFTILWIVASARFFAAAAEMINWNRYVGVTLCLGDWILCFSLGWNGILGQVVLFVGWGVVGMLRDTRDTRGKRREA